jgi:transcriptional regulator with XRE-family HTH domain
VLRRLRKEKDLTQVELAKKAKLTQSYLAELERGDKTNPSLAILQRLAKALGLPIANLLR